MKKQEEATEASFTKEQLLSSKRFEAFQKDVLSVVLGDESSYTIAQAEQLIKETLERKVD